MAIRPSYPPYGDIMRSSLIKTCLIVLVLSFSAQAQTQALNDGFEMQDWTHWTLTGNLDSSYRWVFDFDVVAPNAFSYAYGQVPYTNFSGGLKQTVYLRANVTYEVSADLCYTLC